MSDPEGFNGLNVYVLACPRQCPLCCPPRMVLIRMNLKLWYTTHTYIIEGQCGSG